MRLTALQQTPAAAPPEPETDAPPPLPARPRRGEGPSHLQAAAPRSGHPQGPEFKPASSSPAATAAGAAALELATARLTRGLFNPVTDADAAAVLEALTPLNREALMETLSGLEARGLLSCFLEEQTPTMRAVLVNLLRDRRVLIDSPPTPAPPGPLAPPALPATLAAVPTHLPSLEGLAHEVNAQRARTYRQERDAYLERFVSQVGEATTPGELALLGAPVRQERFRSVGSAKSAWERARALNNLATRSTDEDRVYALNVLTGQQRLIAGNRPALSGRVTAGVSVSDRVRQSGVSITAGPEGVRVQHEVGVTPGPFSLKVQVPRDGGEPVFSAGINARRGAIELGSDGTLKLALQALRVETSPGTGQVGIGLGLPPRWSDLSGVDASIGYSVQLSDPTAAAARTHGRAPPDAPEALSLGRRWETLPPAYRESLEAAGVRGSFWNGVIDANGPPADAASGHSATAPSGR